MLYHITRSNVTPSLVAMNMGNTIQVYFDQGYQRRLESRGSVVFTLDGHLIATSVKYYSVDAPTNNTKERCVIIDNVRFELRLD